MDIPWQLPFLYIQKNNPGREVQTGRPQISKSPSGVPHNDSPATDGSVNPIRTEQMHD